MGTLARRLGFTQVSLSSEVMPMVRAVPRGYTVCADAYLTPKIHQYLKGFTSGFKDCLKVCCMVFLLVSVLIKCCHKGINDVTSVTTILPFFRMWTSCSCSPMEVLLPWSSSVVHEPFSQALQEVWWDTLSPLTGRWKRSL